MSDEEEEREIEEILEDILTQLKLFTSQKDFTSSMYIAIRKAIQDAIRNAI